MYAIRSYYAGTLAREEGEDVGFYTITIGTLSLGDNYTIDLVPDNFEITQQDITVVVYANQYKSYGQADPDFIYWITGILVSGDSFSGALGRVEGEAVGFYQIVITSYSIHYTKLYDCFRRCFNLF